MASAGGNTVPAIARLVATSEDRVREMIHRFNDTGDGDRWTLSGRVAVPAGSRLTTRRSSSRRPPPAPKLGPAVHPMEPPQARRLPGRPRPSGSCTIGGNGCGQILAAHDVTFQRTKTWKESNDPDRDAKLDRIEARPRPAFPDRCFAFDEFGPLAIRPVGGSAGRQPVTRNGSRRTTTSCTGCDSSTAATRSATTSCGAWCAAASPQATPSPRSRHPRRPPRRRADLRDPGQPVRPQGHQDPGMGRPATGSSCASPRPTAHGRTRSKPSSGRCESSC